jgi:hypothetical protein
MDINEALMRIIDGQITRTYINESGNICVEYILRNQMYEATPARNDEEK